MALKPADLTTLEDALRVLFQTLKRPQHWAKVAEQAGVQIDRPGAVLLRSLLKHQSAHCRLHDLAMQLGVEAPSITRKTQALERAGYVQRVPDPRDKRAISLQITPSGKTVSHKIWQAQRAFVAQALDDWPPDERQEFIRLFERFSQDLARISTSTTK